MIRISRNCLGWWRVHPHTHTQS